MKIMFNKPKRERLRKRYNEAVQKGEDTFVFEGNEFVVSYAKYMLEYLDAPGVSARLPDEEG